MTSRRTPWRRLFPAVATALGLVLVLFGAAHLRHPAHRSAARPFGTVPVASAGPAGPSAADASSVGTSSVGTLSVGTSSVGTSSGGTSSAPPGPPASTPARAPAGDAVPVRLQVSRLHLDAPVVPVRSDGRSIDVPARPATLGWWVGGAAPGSLVGSTVLVGHVDNARTGPGALFHLDRVRAGDQVTVTVTGGATQRYRVTALRTVRKTVGLGSSELGGAGPARLTLITCGGPFDRSSGSYEDNVVAFAEPLT